MSVEAHLSEAEGPLFLTGASGLLGRYLLARLSLDYRVVPVSNTQRVHGGRSVDLCDADATRLALDEIKPRAIVHAAAQSSVDACERNPPMAWAVNVEATRHLVDWARTQKRVVHFVYISTDNIYNAPGPSQETVLRPTNVYGLTKLWGEDLVRSLEASLVLRVNFLGLKNGRGSLVDWLFTSLRAGAPIMLFRDALFNPLYAADLAEIVAEVLRKRTTGTFNCGARGNGLSKADLGLRLAKEFNLSTDCVTIGSIDDAALAAPRPRDTRMVSDRLAGVLGRDLPDTEGTLMRLIEELRQEPPMALA